MIEVKDNKLLIAKEDLELLEKAARLCGELGGVSQWPTMALAATGAALELQSLRRILGSGRSL